MPNCCQFSQGEKTLTLHALDGRICEAFNVPVSDEHFYPPFHAVQFLIAVGQTLEQIRDDTETPQSTRDAAQWMIDEKIVTDAWHRPK